jgi:two-component system, cell cycle response regulator DivK
VPEEPQVIEGVFRNLSFMATDGSQPAEKGNRKILVIEDNEPNLYLITYILERVGHVVICARDGLEGLEKAHEEVPDLVLTDLQLPRLDGYETARRIKATPGLAHIPIVAVTAYAMAGDREKALTCGCVGYIEKPIMPATFAAQIQQFLTRQSPLVAES